jgi:dUTP pyrophosphatase
MSIKVRRIYMEILPRKFEKVSYADDGIIPTRADEGSAGYDFYSTETVVIKPKEVVKIKTNIKASMAPCDVLMLYVRSSIGIKKNLMLANGTGVIDSTYYNNPDNEGNIIIALYNYGDVERVIMRRDRIAQGVFLSYFTAENDEVLSNTRTGGIGSSGV